MTTSSSSVSSSPTISEQEQQIPKWHIKADYIETCNCDYGCPCNFTGFPSNGFCRALVGYHISEVKLDGLDVVTFTCIVTHGPRFWLVMGKSPSMINPMFTIWIIDPEDIGNIHSVLRIDTKPILSKWLYSMS